MRDSSTKFVEPIGVSMHSTQASFKGKSLKVKKRKEDSKTSDISPKIISFNKIRPATAMPIHDMGGTGSEINFNDTLTRPNSSWKKQKIIQPSRLIQSYQSKSKSIFWFEKAEQLQKDLS